MAATKPYLNTLMTAALGLPGIAMGEDSALTDFTVDYKHLYYEEDDFMQVDAEYLSLGIPLNPNNDVAISLEYETISGASPIFSSPGLDGEPIQAVSGASITDKRIAAAVRFRHFTQGNRVFVITPSTSDENDYTSRAFTVEYQWSTSNKNTSYAIGAGYGNDEVEPVGNVDVKENQDRVSLFGGVTRIIDPKSLFQLNLSFSDRSGFLADPYKLAWVDGAILNETRPDNRLAGTMLMRYVRHMGESASMHLSYRFYADEWSMESHTFEAAWHQELPGGWVLSPHIRYYSQDAAEFYAPYFLQNPDDGYYSSDYRLAGFGSTLAGLNIEKSFDKAIISFNAEYYRRQNDLKFVGDYSFDPYPLDSYVMTFGISFSI